MQKIKKEMDESSGGSEDSVWYQIKKISPECICVIQTLIGNNPRNSILSSG